jgi:hypothetical protein
MSWVKILISSLCLAAGLTMGHAPYDLAAAASNELSVWEPPAGTAANATFEVQVRAAGEAAWNNLFVYNVKVGHQNGSQAPSSMVSFDFNGTIDVKVTYVGGALAAYDLRPTSYGITAIQSGNTLLFSMTQNEASPRKLVLRVNDDWEEEVLHMVTNPIETNVVQDNASNVFVIEPDDEIPLRLPAGKDTYYFKPGVHKLPRGMWVELDLGAIYPLNRLVLHPGKGSGASSTVYPSSFVLEAKQHEDDNYETAYDGGGNMEAGTVDQTFAETNARYVRLMLTGNNGSGRDFLSAFVNEMELYASGGTMNLALNNAIAGAMPGYEQIADGNTNTTWRSSSEYGNWHAGESFFLSEDNYKVYLEAGSIVKGSFMADGLSNISITGRGIVDAAELTHYPATLAESRAGAIWIVSGMDNKVEGITVMNAPMWTIVMNFSTRPVVRNVNIFGNMINADGIHFSGSSYGLVEGVFIRTNDDNLVMYHYAAGSHNIFRNSVLWGDDAHIVLIGLGTGVNADITNIIVSNLDVLAQQGVYDLNKFNGVLKLWPNGGNEISNIRFEDIRIEQFRDSAHSMIFQFRVDERFPGEGDGAGIQDVTLENVDYYGSGEMQSLIKGKGSASVSDIRFKDYKRAGAFVTNALSGNMRIEGSVSGVEFSPSDAVLDDRFDEQIAGTAPIGWTSSPGITVENMPGAANKSVQLSKTGSGDIVASRTIPASRGIVTVEANMKIADKTNWKSMIVSDSAGARLLQVGFDSGGNIYTNNGSSWSPLMSYNVNQWYDVRVDINTVSDRYDLYVDGVRVMHNWRLETSADDIGIIRFGSGETSTGTYYFDDVKVTVVPPLLAETFDDQSEGAAPLDWTSSSGITVEHVPSSTNKSVRVNKTESGAIVSSHAFVPTAGIVTVRAKMNISDKTNWKSLIVNNTDGTELLQVGFDVGGHIYANNGTAWGPFMSYNVNQWYDLLLLIDTATNQYDLYIDSILKAENFALETGTTNVGAILFASGETPTGTYYFDDVMVVNSP